MGQTQWKVCFLISAFEQLYELCIMITMEPQFMAISFQCLNNTLGNWDPDLSSDISKVKQVMAKKKRKEKEQELECVFVIKCK